MDGKRFFPGYLISVFVIYAGLILCASCQNTSAPAEKALTKSPAGSMHFKPLSPARTGVTFANDIEESDSSHYFIYPYIYNGGGVALGDLDGDTLPEIYLTSNMGPDRLYANLGDLTFQDVTKSAGIRKQEEGWHSGVTMWDVNADGLLDIYVSRSGWGQDPEMRKNLLFINQGNLEFEERAGDFGLDDPGFTTQAYPFDYDRDGLVDVYLVTHRNDFIKNSSYDFEDDRKIIPEYSDKLYRNTGRGRFEDVSEEAGIQNKAWGLSGAVGDFNHDGWPDIYVCNDFHQPDQLFINQKDGTFSDQLASYFPHISFYSMGSDMADVNNDGMRDLMVLDMTPEDYRKSKRMMASMSTENFWRLVDAGYHFQYMVNMLHIDRGIGQFSDIGQLAGVARTDWSWAALFADFDHDTHVDLFVTNGIKRDVIDNDFKHALNNALKASRNGISWERATSMMPVSTVANYLFQNRGDFRFHNMAEAWGLGQEDNSNGAAYADLDLDGDLDLVINRLEEEAQIIENRSPHHARSICVVLHGPPTNPHGIGSTVALYAGGRRFVRYIQPSRGFQSSVPPVAHFGLDTLVIDSIRVMWPDGRMGMHSNTTVKRHIHMHHDAAVAGIPEKEEAPLFIEENTIPPFRHRENDFNDFTEEVLLPHRLSRLGPQISVGDVNQDGRADFYIGGAAGSPGGLFIQQQDGGFSIGPSQPWIRDAQCEDLGSRMLDVDGDQDLDLYVVSGGALYLEGHFAYQDRVYLNMGNGEFVRAEGSLPAMRVSGQCIATSDIDGDGDEDIFVGGRMVPGHYPKAPRSFLLENTDGRFQDVTQEKAKDLLYPGMVTDAVFADIDNDEDDDLLVVGEWMAIRVLENHQGKFTDITSELGMQHYTGWWSTIVAADWDQDGDTDFVAGNIGANNKYKPSPEKPLHVYGGDFDQSGTPDIILGLEKKSALVPVRGLECTSQQMASVRNRYQTYRAFSETTLPELLGSDRMEKAIHLEATIFESVRIRNDAGELRIEPLPVEAQFSQINAILAQDFDKDGHTDLLIAGNNYSAEVETVRYDASVGLFLKGDGQGAFEPIPPHKSGFVANGDVKSMVLLDAPGLERFRILTGRNNEATLMFRVESLAPSDEVSQPSR